MALERCPECLKEISTDATTCPKCGHDLPEDWVVKKQIFRRRLGVGCLSVFAVFLVGGLLTQNFGGDRDASGRPCGDPTNAYFMSETFIEKRLKAPSSASFSGYRKAIIKRLACRKWHVIAYVDAQNSFGAKIRTYYEVILLFDGDETWNLVGFRILK